MRLRRTARPAIRAFGAILVTAIDVASVSLPLVAGFPAVSYPQNHSHRILPKKEGDPEAITLCEINLL
jgi:hypothetical protein